MSPREYLHRYTRLTFQHPLDRTVVAAGLTNYGAGKTRKGPGVASPTEVERERLLFTQALRKAHHGNAQTPCGEEFFFRQPPLGNIPPSEVFYARTIVRAFLGKASPDEIIDVLRIATAVGRIGTARDANGQPPARATAADYVTSFITLDCNGFAGGYFGVNGDVDIRTFAPAGRRRTSIGEIVPGDAVVTHCPTVPYEHVGVIDAFARNGDGTYHVAIAEWGWFGPERTHYVVMPEVRIVQGPQGEFGLGWHTTSNKVPLTPTFRYLFGRPSASHSLGWL